MLVKKEGDAFSGLVLDDDAPQRRGIILARRENRQYARLIAHNVARGLIDRMRISSFEFRIAFGSCNKEGVHRMQLVQSAEIQMATIHQVIRAGLDRQVIEDIDFVGLAVGDVNEAGDRASQIEQRVQFDCPFGGSKRRSRIHRQTQLDRCGVERVYRRVQVHLKRFAGIQRARHRNQMLRKIGVDLPGTRSIRVSQCIARNCRTSKAHVIQTMGLCAQIDFDVAQRFPISQLRERHGKELIQTGKIFDLVFATMSSHATPKGCQRQIGHELRENELALMHRSLRQKSAKSANFAPRRSNRDQTKTSIYTSESLTYELLT